MQMVQGAVPGVAPVGAVPPEIGSALPGPLSVADHTVVMTSCVPAVAVFAECCMKLAVYGAVSANCL